jgi:hypothetical protein
LVSFGGGERFICISIETRRNSSIGTLFGEQQFRIDKDAIEFIAKKLKRPKGQCF